MKTKLYSQIILFALFFSVCEKINAQDLQQAYNNGNLIQINATNRPVDIRNGGQLSMALSSIITGTGLSAAGRFGNFNPSNSSASLQSYTQSTNISGRGGLFGVATSASPTHGLVGYTYGTGVGLYGLGQFPNSRAGYFLNDNVANVQDALYSENKGSGNSLRSVNTGTGRAGYFNLSSGTTPATVVEMTGSGIGHVLYASTGSVLDVNKNVGRFVSFNVNNTRDVLYTESLGYGIALSSIHSGLGQGLNFYPGTFMGMRSTTTNFWPPLWVQRMGPGQSSPTGSSAIVALLSGVVNNTPNADVIYSLGGDSPGGKAIYGVKSNTTPDYAGYFYGNVLVTQTLTKLALNGAAVKDDEGKEINLYAEESAEVWLTDYGIGTLVNGEVSINIEPKFLSTINTKLTYHVFVQLEGLCTGGVIVTNKTSTSFKVVQDPLKQCNAEFSYRITAKRKGFENLRLPGRPEATEAGVAHLKKMWPEVVRENDNRIQQTQEQARALEQQFPVTTPPPSDPVPNVNPGAIPAEGETGPQ